MAQRKIVVPERSRFRDLAGMDVVFIAILGLITLAIFVGWMMKT
jgi:hypothetical protein